MRIGGIIREKESKVFVSALKMLNKHCKSNYCTLQNPDVSNLASTELLAIHISTKLAVNGIRKNCRKHAKVHIR